MTRTTAQVPPPGAGAPAVLGPCRLVAGGDGGGPRLAGWIDALSVHCPYLGPSLRRGLTRLHHYQVLPAAPFGDVEAAVFTAGAWAAKTVRARRTAGRGWACEVITLDWPAPDPQPAAILNRPHWAIKCAWAPVGVLPGKFAPGAGRPDRAGRTVPDPPLPVLAVRDSVPAADPDLLRSTPGIGRVLAQAREDGRDILGSVPGVREAGDPLQAWPAINHWASHLTDLESSS
ncbi:hypothetical protein [Streptomyces aidingensis]|uniref:Uncharacterized protein n=1 Tax=Streptomyces aidingensis TaxID=910347 RepID=A0A1I1HB84_9ACTN|nr:hypothetical protein [Streptomyces aidingensis]SFC18370.1 hypothetical protein SAMN05421773_102234 [Streptomyces aidingensis]